MNVREHGFEIASGFANSAKLDELITAVSELAIPSRGGGLRNADKRSAALDTYARSAPVLAAASRHLAGKPSLVRAILFNKTRENNWLVAWHQDKTVAVTERFDAEGWGPWSTKDETPHVQPPLAVLNDMITLRLHLDDANAGNGMLRVMPGSHTQGVMTADEISAYVSAHTAVDCQAARGDALFMRPHLLHASSKGTQPSQRRVLHLEYSSFALPAGIDWA